MKRSIRALVLASSALAAACSSDKPRGELMLVVDTNMAAGVDFDVFRIEVTSTATTGYDRVVSTAEFGQPGLPVRLPATVAIIGNGDPSTLIHIRISSGLAPTVAQPGQLTKVGIPKTLREVATTVPTNRIAMLRMPIEWLCSAETVTKQAQPDNYVDTTCTQEGTTCHLGECVPQSVDSSTLPDYSDGAVFGGSSASGPAPATNIAWMRTAITFIAGVVMTC